MTQHKIYERIAAGRKKAFTRRGSSEKLGIRRTKVIVRRIEEEVVVSQPKTPEEIEESILAGQRRANERLKRRERDKQKNKEVGVDLREMGFRIDHSLTKDRLFSIAYRPVLSSNKTEVFFSIRSPRDQFSRPAAREALLKHANNSTHRIEIESDILDRTAMTGEIANKIIEKMKTHPQEFPSSLVNIYKEVAPALDAYKKMVVEMKKLLQ